MLILPHIYEDNYEFNRFRQRYIKGLDHLNNLDNFIFDNKKDIVEAKTMGIKDLDKKGMPIGLRSEVKSQFAAGTGKFNVILKHQPPVNGKAVKTGNEEGGSTDVDVTFPVTIK